MIIASRPFSPGQRGEVIAPFPIEQRATGVYMDLETGKRFHISRIDRLSPGELAQLAPAGIVLVSANGAPRHGLRIAVHYAVCPHGGGDSIFRAQVDLVADTGLLEHELGFVAEAGMKAWRDEQSALRKSGHKPLPPARSDLAGDAALERELGFDLSRGMEPWRDEQALGRKN